MKRPSRRAPTRRSAAPLVAFVLLLAACSGAESDPAPDTSRAGSESSNGTVDVSRLLFLRGRVMFSLDLETGAERRLAEMPSQDVFTFGGDFVVVEDRGAGGDFAERPFISIRSASGQVLDEVGEGFAPLVSDDGRIAFLRSSGERLCEGEVCLGALEVLVADASGASPRRLLPPGEWHPLAWAGDSLIVADGARPDRALVIGADGGERELPFAPNEIWDATAEHVIVVRDGLASWALATEERTPIVADGIPAEGDITGSEVTVVMLERSRSRLARFSLPGGDVRLLPGSDGAMGPVLTSSEGGPFLFARARGKSVEAIFCRTEATCEPVLRWKEGVTPVALR